MSRFSDARDQITGHSWLDDLARASLSAAEAKFSATTDRCRLGTCDHDDWPGAPCPFCQRIAAGEYETICCAEAPCIHNPTVVTFEPLNPVTPGHRLFLPVRHVEDALRDPCEAADITEYAARWASRGHETSGGWSTDCNLIMSAGAAATQTVRHLHLHLVPRSPGDGLHLPWTGQGRAR